MRSKSRSRFAATFLSVLVTAVLVFGPAVPAFATIYMPPPDPVVTSVTNPGDPTDYSVGWREGWGNNLLPEFDAKVPPVDKQNDPGVIYGAVYGISRLEATVVPTITPDMWPNLYMEKDLIASTWKFNVDMRGEVLNPGYYFGTAPRPAAAERDYEGYYRLFYRFLALNEPAGAWGNAFRYGIDVTPPEQVTGLKMYLKHPAAGGVPIASGSPTTQSRLILTWDDKLYDKLSGTGYFGVYVDGKPYVPANETDQKRAFDLKEHFSTTLASGVTTTFGIFVNTPRQVTIEDMPAGEHTIQVAAVDRATNEGPLSTPQKIFVDPDIPTVEITWPDVNGSTIGAKPIFMANVTDKGGVAKVGFYVDDQLLGVDTDAPYVMPADLSYLTSGSTHTLRVVAVDRADQHNYAEKNFVLDKTAPVLSGLSFGPNPFYPVLRDGYKDNFVVRFTTSEPATATLTIKNSRGRVIRKIEKFVSAGAKSFVWNGANTAGTVSTGTFTWSLSLADSSRNVSRTAWRSLTIRDYEIVRTSNNTVRIIPR